MRRTVVVISALAACAVTALIVPTEAAARGLWRPTGSLAVARAQHTATPLANGRILVAGGRVSDTVSTASAEAYDPVSGTWGVVGSLAASRSFQTATRLQDGRVLVAGGLGGTAALSSAETFSPAGNTWSQTAPMSVPRSHHTASLLPNGRVLVVGGSGADGEPTGSVEIFDPMADGGAGAWTTGPTLSVARTQHTATALADGTVLVVGGTTCGAPPPGACPTGSAEIFDPAANGGAGAWTAVASAGGARYDHTATRLADGRVLVAGGIDGFGVLRRSAEVFDATTRTGPPSWSDATPMTRARADFDSALLPDGRVLVTGGGTGTVIDIEESEIWSPITSGWSPTGSLSTGRHGHRLTTLIAPGCGTRCGNVLISGGQRRLPSEYLALADLYDPSAEQLQPPPGPPSAPASTPPGRVIDLTATALSTSSIRLTFSAPGSPPATRYVIRQAKRRINGEAEFGRARALCGGTCVFGARAAGERLSLRVTGLRPKRTYFYALRAVSAAGARAAISNVATARTPFVRPGRTRGLRLRALSPTRMALTFGATGTPPAGRYVVRQARSPITSAARFRAARSLCRRGTCRLKPRAAGDRVKLVVTRLEPGRRYCFAVRARDGRRLAPRSKSICGATRRARSSVYTRR